jgi:hypothetical protein
VGGVLSAHADRARTRPWVRLGVATAALAGSVAIAVGAPDELGIGSLRLVEVPERPAPEQAELVVVLRGGPDEPVDSRIFATAQDVVSAQLEADPTIAAVRAIARERQVALVAEFDDVSDADRQSAAIRLASEVDPGPLSVAFEGEVQRLLEARRELADELLRAELLALPLALLLAAMAIGGRAAAPALCAGISIAGSLALLRVAGLIADVSLLGVAPAAAVGLVLGVELPLAVSGSASGRGERLARRTLIVAAVASLPALAGLATPLDQAASLALGCALAAFLAAGAALLVAPAVDQLTGPSEILIRRPWSIPRLAAALGLGAGVVCLGALVVPAVRYGASAPYVALDSPALSAAATTPERLPGDSLFADLPAAAALASAILALALATLARRPWALLLGPITLLPAAAGVGICVLFAEHGWFIGRDDAQGPFIDSATVAVALAGLAAIGAARSAALALDLRERRRPLLGPAAGASSAGLIAAGAMIPVAGELGIALGAGLICDFLLLRVGLWAVANGWIGSGDG